MSELDLIILDEVSLIGADMLYRIHMRLREIFQCDDLFANKSIILVGDLLQLKPVKASYIFETPKSKHFQAFHKISPLWQSFTPIVLTKNHRQREERLWAESLNRISKGILTQDDEALLRSRVTTEEFLEHDAMHVMFTNKEVGNHNTKMLNKLPSELFEFKAVKSGPKFYIPHITEHGTIDKTQMMNNLELKVGARVKL